jgi:hypothetical protein
MKTVRRKRAPRYSQLFVLVLSVFLFLLPISYSHATGFFCPNDEAVSDYTFIYFSFSSQINVFVYHSMDGI